MKLKKFKIGNKEIHPAFVISAIAVIAIILIAVLILVFGKENTDYLNSVNDYIKFANEKSTDDKAFEENWYPEQRLKLIRAKEKITGQEDSSVGTSPEYWKGIYDRLDTEFKDWEIDFEESETKTLSDSEVSGIQKQFAEANSELYGVAATQWELSMKSNEEIKSLIEQKKITEEEAKEYCQANMDYCKAFATYKVTEVKEVTGKVVVKADSKTWKSKSAILQIAKINGEWVSLGTKNYIEFEETDTELFLFQELWIKIEADYSGRTLYWAEQY